MNRRLTKLRLLKNQTQKNTKGAAAVFEWFSSYHFVLWYVTLYTPMQLDSAVDIGQKVQF